MMEEDCNAAQTVDVSLGAGEKFPVMIPGSYLDNCIGLNTLVFQRQLACAPGRMGHRARSCGGRNSRKKFKAGAGPGAVCENCGAGIHNDAFASQWSLVCILSVYCHIKEVKLVEKPCRKSVK